jgi:putative membrane protein
MLSDALLAYAHYLAILSLFIVLAIEFAICRAPLDRDAARLISRVDLGYLVAALAVVATGFARASFGPKGWPFYASNPFFWTKLGLFALVGLLSLVPTVAFIRWSRAGMARIARAEIGRARIFVAVELGLLALVPLFASLMSRGIKP